MFNHQGKSLFGIFLSVAPELDPIYGATLEPLKLAVAAVFCVVMPRPTIQYVLAQTAASIALGATTWATASGPAASLQLALRRVERVYLRGFLEAQRWPGVRSRVA